MRFCARFVMQQARNAHRGARTLTLTRTLTRTNTHTHTHTHLLVAFAPLKIVLNKRKNPHTHSYLNAHKASAGFGAKFKMLPSFTTNVHFIVLTMICYINTSATNSHWRRLVRPTNGHTCSHIRSLSFLAGISFQIFLDDFAGIRHRLC